MFDIRFGFIGNVIGVIIFGAPLVLMVLPAFAVIGICSIDTYLIATGRLAEVTGFLVYGPFVCFGCIALGVILYRLIWP